MGAPPANGLLPNRFRAGEFIKNHPDLSIDEVVEQALPHYQDWLDEEYFGAAKQPTLVNWTPVQDEAIKEKWKFYHLIA